MEFTDKLNVLGEGAKYDLSCACGESTHRQADPLDRWIYPAVLPDGKTANILKVLQSNVCEKNCFYCANRCGRDRRPATFGADELARGFMELYRQRRVMGLFLSSAVTGSAVKTMDRMLATSEILRARFGFKGYLHLKILPGAQEAQVERAGWLATRVSLNLEVPSRKYLDVIAPTKKAEDLLQPLAWIRKFEQNGNRGWAPSGFTTQFMVGAAGESDREIVASTFSLYRTQKARRIYFSAFQPVENTPLENRPGCPLWREHRLYQCDFLFRRYGFKLDEILFDEGGGLRRDEDPKLSWVKQHPEIFPLEVNAAPIELLMRIPGIGPVSARKIAKLRRESRFLHPGELRRVGALYKKAAPYLLFAGAYRPGQLQML